jgi:thioredoxin reductase
VVLERGPGVGTFFKTYPRHRKLISVNKVHTGTTDREKNLRWDWNSLLTDAGEARFTEQFADYFPAADDFVKYLEGFSRRHALHVEYGADIERIERDARDARFYLYDRFGRCWSCDRLIVATGLARPNIPDIPGIELAESYTETSIDPEDFVGQAVMVLGKGNSGFETADNLVQTTAVLHMLSPEPVRLAWQTHYVGNLRAVNNNLLDTYQLKLQNTILDATVERIERDNGALRVDILYTHARNERRSIRVDRVIHCAGFSFDATPFGDSCRPNVVPSGKYPDMSSAWESVNVPDLFFAGTLMHMRDYRRSFSGFIHGFRYNIKAFVALLRERYAGVALACVELPPGVDDLLAALMRRIDRNSGLFQLPGFLGDLIVYSRAGNAAAKLYVDLPLDHLLPRLLADATDVLTLTMEYGARKHPDPFAIERDPADGNESHFIHPVIRYYREGVLVATHHVPEDLENQWNHDRFRLPLRAFLKQQVEWNHGSAGIQ